MSTKAIGGNMNAGASDEEMETYGKPDGPMVFIPEFGEEVGTFTQKREDLYKAKDPGKVSLMHHVPRKYRGYFKPSQCANYDPEEFEYLTDDHGYALCTAVKSNGADCTLKAVHRSWLCTVHGGKLHPLDKVISDARAAMPGGNASKELVAPEVKDRMTRWQLLLHGFIKVEDLDDEELARGQCRQPDGTFSNQPPKNIPKFLHDEMTKRLFERANEQMRGHLMGAVAALGTIASGDAYEPQDRIKAAQLIIERVLGKNPDVIVHKQDAPWEIALRAIGGGTRAESRAARGLDPDTGQPMVLEGSYEELAPVVQVDAPAQPVPATVDRELTDPDGEPIDLGKGGVVDAEALGRDFGDSDDRRSMGLDHDVAVDRDSGRRSLGEEAERQAEAAAERAELAARFKKGRAKRGAARRVGLSSTGEADPPLKIVSKPNEDGTFQVGFSDA